MVITVCMSVDIAQATMIYVPRLALLSLTVTLTYVFSLLWEASAVEQPFQCTACHMSFKTVSGLIGHQASNSHKERARQHDLQVALAEAIAIKIKKSLDQCEGGALANY